MKKVLLVNDHIRFSGGGDAVLFQEKLILENSGYDVYTFSITRDTNESDKHFSYSVSRTNLQKKVVKFSGFSNLYKEFDEVVRKIDPDVIHLHLISNDPAGFYKSTELIDRYVIQTLHGPNLICATSWGCLKHNSAPCDMNVGVKCATRKCVSTLSLPLHLNLHRLIKANWYKIDVFHCPSMHLYRTIKRLTDSKAVYFPLTNSQIFLDTDAKSDWGSDPVILYVGALAVQKGVEYLIKAFPKILDSVPSAKVVIAGKGVEENKLIKLVQDLNIENHIEFKGFVPRSNIIELYKSASVVVVPSIWQEQFGVVGIEALLCGVPCVGSHIGGISEWLHDEQWGYLVPPRSVEDLENAIIKLISNPEKSKEMGLRGRDFVKSYYSNIKFENNILKLMEAND